MFKELKIFMDEVGSFTGRTIKRMLSDKDNEHEIDGLTGHIVPKRLDDYDISSEYSEIRLDELDKADSFKLHEGNE